MKIDRFRIQVNKGRMRFNSESHAALFSKFLDQWDGQEVFIQILEKKNTRSEQQHSYYWLYLGIISDETGENKEVLHEYFKNKFLITEITELYGDKIRIKKSTTGLTKGEFSDYIANIAQLTGIESPDTSKVWGFTLVSEKKKVYEKES